jgi:hypothetical protein
MTQDSALLSLVVCETYYFFHYFHISCTVQVFTSACFIFTMKYILIRSHSLSVLKGKVVPVLN